MVAQISMRHWRTGHLSSIAYLPEQLLLRRLVNDANTLAFISFTPETVAETFDIIQDVSVPAIVTIQRLVPMELIPETDADGEEVDFFNYSIYDSDLSGFYRGEPETAELVFDTDSDRAMFATVLARHHGFRAIWNKAVEQGCIPAPSVP